MAVRLRTWIWIAVAIVVVGIIGMIAMAGVGVYYVSRHVKATEASPAVASRSFDETRKMFADPRPVIEVDERGSVVRSNLTGRPTSPHPPQALYILAYNPEEGQMVRFSIPFWILRFKGDSSISFNESRIDLEELKITVHDLERIGPALLFDHKTAEGEHVLVWSQ